MKEERKTTVVQAFAAQSRAGELRSTIAQCLKSEEFDLRKVESQRFSFLYKQACHCSESQQEQSFNNQALP